MAEADASASMTGLPEAAVGAGEGAAEGEGGMGGNGLSGRERLRARGEGGGAGEERPAGVSRKDWGVLMVRLRLRRREGEAWETPYSWRVPSERPAIMRVSMASRQTMRAAQGIWQSSERGCLGSRKEEGDCELAREEEEGSEMRGDSSPRDKSCLSS